MWMPLPCLVELLLAVSAAGAGSTAPISRFPALPRRLRSATNETQHSQTPPGGALHQQEKVIDRRLGDGGITVSWFGTHTVKYFVGAEIVNSGTGLVLTAEPFMKVTLMNSPKTTSTNPADFAYLQLAGNSVRVNVNMGSPGASCGCNVAFFLVSMPSPSPGQYGDYYCDANCVGGNCCPEFDLIEMNTHALQVTNHKCNNYRKPSAQYSSSECDHGGSPIVKFNNGGSEFGPGSQFTINSQQPFEFRMDFPIEGGILKGHVTLSQNGRTVRHTMENLESIRGALTDGMALVLDAWEATDMTWLDGGSCPNPSYCNKASTIFDTLVLESLGGPGPSPSPAPSSGGPSPGPRPNHQCACGWANPGTCVHDDGSVCFQVCCCSCDWANPQTCQNDDGSSCFHACCYTHNEVSHDALWTASGAENRLRNHLAQSLLWMCCLLFWWTS